MEWVKELLTVFSLPRSDFSDPLHYDNMLLMTHSRLSLRQNELLALCRTIKERIAVFPSYQKKAATIGLDTKIEQHLQQSGELPSAHSHLSAPQPQKGFYQAAPNPIHCSYSHLLPPPTLLEPTAYTAASQVSSRSPFHNPKTWDPLCSGIKKEIGVHVPSHSSKNIFEEAMLPDTVVLQNLQRIDDAVFQIQAKVKKEFGL